MSLDKVEGKVLVPHIDVLNAWERYKATHGFTDWQHGQDAFCKLLGTDLMTMQAEYYTSTDHWQLTPEAAHKVEMLNSEHWHTILKAMEAKQDGG